MSRLALRFSSNACTALSHRELQTASREGPRLGSITRSLRPRRSLSSSSMPRHALRQHRGRGSHRGRRVPSRTLLSVELRPRRPRSLLRQEPLPCASTRSLCPPRAPDRTNAIASSHSSPSRCIPITSWSHIAHRDHALAFAHVAKRRELVADHSRLLELHPLGGILHPGSLAGAATSSWRPSRNIPTAWTLAAYCSRVDLVDARAWAALDVVLQAGGACERRARYRGTCEAESAC